MPKYRLSIILPTYHEENNIKKVITGIEKYVKTPHKTIVVLQDKNDPTIQALSLLRKNITSLEIIFTKDGKGMLKALKRGIKYAKSEIIVITMADLSDNPRDIDKMVAKINEGYDLVCGSRYMKNGKHLGGPFIKGLLSRIGCLTLKYITGVPTHDATNAFKCFRKSIMNKITIQSEEGFEMPLELTVKAHEKGFSITEIPTTWKDRVRGDSKFKTYTNLKFYLRWYLYGIKKNM
jgi:glycosyltransferase involved in cell wall biosynthesis